MSKDDDWKVRYLDEAAAWEATEERLRYALGRVAIAAEGSSEELDAALHRLQRHVRAKADEDLDRDIEAISELVKRLEFPKPLAPPESQGPSRAPDATPLAQDFCADLIEALHVSDERAQGLQRFRQGLSQMAPAECLGKLAVEISKLLREEQSLDGGVREVLLALIEEVALVQPGLGALQTLRESLQRGETTDWDGALSRIIGELRTTIQRINADKGDLEALLTEVHVELGDIAGVLVTERAGLATGKAESASFQDLVNLGVRRIQDHIETESDIDRLKDGVSQSLGEIRSAITEFSESDGQRLEEAERRNQELLERVASMEEESQRLRKGLDRKREQLMQDTLTGVRSRLAYDETVAQELARYRRYREAFSMAVLDIDHFKSINDRYGHAAGDKALQLVARKIRDGLRESDLVFRVGGEEFVLILPKTGFSAAKAHVETVRQIVGDAAFHFEGTPVSITLSAGVTVVRDEDTAATIFARADDAMYRAKNAGRNRLVGLE